MGENALNRVISLLRRLAEALNGAFALETITKVGYRLSPALADDGAPPQGGAGLIDASSPAVVESSPPEAAGPQSRAARRAVVVGGVVALAAAVAGAALVRRSSLPPRARQLVALGRQALEAARPDQDRQAVAYLRNAVELAPRSGEAWGALSLALLTQVGRSGDGGMDADRAWARSAARRALELDAHDADAQVTLVLAAPVYRHWSERGREMTALLQRHARHDVLAVAYADLLLQVGRWRTAAGVLERLAAAPLNASRQIQWAATLWGAGRLPEADRAFADAVRLWPAHPWAWSARFNFLTLNGRAEEAAAMAQDETAPAGAAQPVPVALGLGAARALASPSREGAEAVRTGLVAARGRHEVAAVQAVIYLAALGAVDDAFEVLEGYLFPDAPAAGLERKTFMLFGTATGALRRDARFAPLTRRLGLDVYWRDARARPEVAD